VENGKKCNALKIFVTKKILGIAVQIGQAWYDHVFVRALSNLPSITVNYKLNLKYIHCISLRYTLIEFNARISLSIRLFSSLITFMDSLRNSNFNGLQKRILCEVWLFHNILLDESIRRRGITVVANSEESATWDWPLVQAWL